MYATSESFLTALKNPIKQLFLKLEFYNYNNELITVFDTESNLFANQNKANVNTSNSNSISVDMTRTIQRSFSFSLVNSQSSDALSFNWAYNSPVWIANRVKVYTGLKLSDGTIDYIPQGVFIITSPYDTNDSQNANSVYITGQDKSYLLTGNRGKFAHQITFQKGLDIKTAIKQMAQSVGETLFNFDESISTTLPYDLTFQSTDNKWKAMTQFATLATCDLFYDVDGYLRLQKTVTDYSKEPPVWSYKYNDPLEKFYAGNQRKFDESNFSNHIQVIGGSSQTDAIFFEIVVDETKPYTLSYTLAQQSDFQNGTYSNTMDIPLNTELKYTDTNNILQDVLSIGGIQLSKVGSDSDTKYKTQSDFQKYTSQSNVQAIDDTDYNSLPVIQQGHLELDGFRQDWYTGVTSGQVLYGVGAIESATANPSYYTLSSTSGTDAESHLNTLTSGSYEDVSDGIYEAFITVPSSGSAGDAGIIYRTSYWGNENNSFGYYVGFDSTGHLIFGRGSNSSTGSYTQLKNVDLSVSSGQVVLSNGTEHSLKIIASGSTHTIFVDDIQEIQMTDSTYTSSGGYGFRVNNCTAEFRLFGYYPDASSSTMTGYRINQIDLSGVKTAGKTSVSWNDNLPVSNQTITVDVRLSTDNGSTWGSWTTISNQGTLSMISVGQNMSNTQLQVRETITSLDATQSPQISNMEILIESEFISSGTYESNNLILTDSKYQPNNNSGKILWDAIIPTSSQSMIIEISTSKDGGKTFNSYVQVLNEQELSDITDVYVLSDFVFKLKITMSSSDLTVSPQLVDITIQADSNIWKDNPYSIQKVGDVLYQHNNGSPDPLITTDFQAKWRAKYDLMHRLGFVEQVTVSLAPLWIHDVRDVVEIEDSVNGLTGNYLLQSFQLPLTPALVQSTVVKTDNFITDWEAI